MISLYRPLNNLRCLKAPLNNSRTRSFNREKKRINDTTVKTDCKWIGHNSYLTKTKPDLGGLQEAFEDTLQGPSKWSSGGERAKRSYGLKNFPWRAFIQTELLVEITSS